MRQVTVEQQSELFRKAFDQVCNEADWKAPIDCLVPWGLANLYIQAIEFMTGTVPTCERLIKDCYAFAHLKANGYRMGPAGDH